MSVNKLPHGAFQWTLSFNLDQLQADQFLEEEGLELPSSLRFAIKKRQIEFLCGRLCAKSCMESLGYTHPPVIPTGEDRAPVWPADLMGSISHTDRLATAVVGPAAQIESIGIDIERVIEEATPQMIKHICCDLDELEEISALQKISREEALTLIFSGKESLYKAVYPKLQRFYGFQAARVKAFGSNRLKIMLVTDLSDTFEQGTSWDLHSRMPSANLIETMVLKPRT
jgi:enterobactin synthetase component D